MLDDFLNRARQDLPVYLCDVRDVFQEKGRRPFHLQVTLYDATVRRFALRLPDTKTPDEAAFVEDYIHAMVYNILCALGAVSIAVYIDPSDKAAADLAHGLPATFQTALSKERRFGFGKCLNVNERTLAILTEGQKKFSFQTFDITQEPPVAQTAPRLVEEPVFSRLPAVAADKMVLGMDIGGTDIKLTASVNGQLAVCKEFDWFPAAFTEAHQLVDPILMMARLLRAATSLWALGRAAAFDSTALSPHATTIEMERGIDFMERAAGTRLRGFDAIGLCFPDVVIRNRIVGGETYKTRGMRANKALDYEAQFAQISMLCDRLSEYVVPGGVVMNTNDGPMAAFTAAVEQAAAGGDVSKGFFAHTLGTELGAGWVMPDGSIPEIPLEVYNFIIDLGSRRQTGFGADDVRSILNFNTDLPGTLQKHTCQSGVFRLAAKLLPDQDPALYQELLDKGLFVEKDGKLLVPTEPVDLRKPCLEFFMAKATEGHNVCCEIFRQVGEFLAVTWRETDYILEPETKERTLFGRLVKEPTCFRLMCEGAVRRVHTLQQFAADGTLANTPLMRSLDAHPDYTVAQFGQAVGAIYYGCLGLLDKEGTRCEKEQ